MAKLKEEYELKELQNCSFKPKINNNYNTHLTVNGINIIII